MIDLVNGYKYKLDMCSLRNRIKQNSQSRISRRLFNERLS